MWQRLQSLLGRLSRRGNAATGALGERLAADFLGQRGYRVVAKNWRRPADKRDEIDLVCRDGEILVFVEVKARRAGALVQGFDAVDARKKRAVLRAAKDYLRKLRPAPRTYRFDVVEIALEADGRHEVRHFENVALFSKGFRP